MRLLFSWFLAASSCCFLFFCFPLHCLDSMSECLGRIISNAFTVSVEKHFDLRQTPLINWPCLIFFLQASRMKNFPQAPSALLAALLLTLWQGYNFYALNWRECGHKSWINDAFVKWKLWLQIFFLHICSWLSIVYACKDFPLCNELLNTNIISQNF